MIQPVKEKIILGIDPGTTIMGYGVLRVKGTKPEMIAMGIIDLRKFANHYLKLRHIHERVLSLAAAYCHFLQMGRPAMEKGYSSWKDFIAKNPDKVK